MDGSGIVYFSVERVRPTRRRDLEDRMDLSRGQIDRWVSSKGHHLPNLQMTKELIQNTLCGHDACEHPIVLWLIEGANEGAPKHTPRPMSADELAREFLEFGADFGKVATAALDAVNDKEISRVEAMRIKNALMDIVSTSQVLLSGVEPYI